MQIFYLDTSIWLDLFEERDEPHLPKSKIARKVMEKIVLYGDRIIYSNGIIKELLSQGYPEFELEELFNGFHGILEYIEATESQINRARELSATRDVPKMDALHALIARDQEATLISRDRDFDRLSDIVETKKPEELL